MAEDNREFILKILEDLRQNEMRKLELLLNGKKIENCKLENLDANKATILFLSYFEKPLETLKDIVHGIPRQDLIQKIENKIEADMTNKGEAQNNEIIKSCPRSSDRPPYTGKYTLFDLEDYATKNQYQLIMHLKKILQPNELNELKKQLMCSVLNTFFSFTAQKYYELYRNGEVRAFFQNIPDKPKKIPMKLLNILFSKKKNNRKRKVQEQMQREGNINLKKKQFVNIDDDDNNVPDKVTIGIENEKTIPSHPIEHKPDNEDSNVIEERRPDEDSRMATENRHEKNENEKTTPIHPIEHKPGNEDSNVIEECWPDEDSRMATENRHEKNENEKTTPIHPIEHKPGNEDSNVIEECWPDEDSRKAIKNWYEKKKNNYRERISLNYICIHEHQAYSCFTAQDVLQFKLPDDQDYRILAIVQDKKDFTNSQKLKKEVEFALQFNMAVLDVQFSEVTSSNRFVCERQADGSFAESESFFKNIVFEIVLPVLALYKWVKLNAFNNVYQNKEIEIFQ